MNLLQYKCCKVPTCIGHLLWPSSEKYYMKDSGLPASALVLPHPQTIYTTLRGNQFALSSTGLLPSGRNVCTVTMNDYATKFSAGISGCY